MEFDYGATIRTIAKAISDDLDSGLSEDGLSFTELRFMRFVRIKGRPVRIRELEEFYGYAFPTVSGTVKSLERRGMVELVPDETDRRVRLVRLSDRGMAAMEVFDDRRRAMEERLLEGIGDREREGLADLLERMCRNVCGDDPSKVLPLDPPKGE